MRRSVYGPGEDQPNPEMLGASTRAWWGEKPEQMGAALVETVRAVMNDQVDYITECESNLRMYRNLQNSGTLPFRYLKVDHQGREVGSAARRVGMNVARPMCNTVASKIGKERPRMMYHTDGAGRLARTQAKKIQLYRDGLMYEQKLYQKSPRALLDALTMGTGYLRAQQSLGKVKHKKVEIKRIFTPQLFIDRIEGAEGNPRNWYEIEFIDKYELAYRFPDDADTIKQMKANWSGDPNIWWKNFAQGSDHATLMIYRGYHLPTEEGADDGHWCVGIGDLTLHEAPWVDIESPYAVYRWLESPDGFYGMGLCEELRGVQGEINRLLRRIQAAMILLSAPYVFADKNAGLEAGMMRGIPGSVIKHNSRMQPHVEAPSVVHPEVFSHLDRLYQRAFETAGVSQLSATAKIPANLESGRAVLVHEDVQTERFALADRGWQTMHQEIDNKALRCAKRINHQVDIIDPVSRALRKMDWKEMSVDGFVIKCTPTSLLATEPSGKLDNFERLDAQGLVLDPEEKLEQLDDPDLDAFTHRHTAQRRYYEKLFEGMLYEGKPYEKPDGALSLKKGILLAQDMYIQALADDVEPASLDKITMWINTARIMEENAKKLSAPEPTGASLPLSPPGGGVAPALPPGMPPLPMAPPGAEPPMPPMVS